MNRRKFIRNTGVAAGIGILYPALFADSLMNTGSGTLRVGVIGVGMRGRGLVDILIRRNDVDLVAISDIAQDSVDKTMELIKATGKSNPKVFLGG